MQVKFIQDLFGFDRPGLNVPVDRNIEVRFQF
jgi:hypothetical protein